jgi:NifU-like protein
MTFYPAKINQHFTSPQNAGELQKADVVGTSGSFVCGAVLKIYLQIESGKIAEAKFKAAGCGYLIAAADVLCEKLISKTIYQDINVFETVENELGKFIAGRKHCLELVRDCFTAAINDYRKMYLDGWNGDEALICTCFGVSEKTIERAVADNLLTTVEQVTDVCKAGGGCGSCQPLIEEIIADVWRG